MAKKANCAICKADNTHKGTYYAARTSLCIDIAALKALSLHDHGNNHCKLCHHCD